MAAAREAVPSAKIPFRSKSLSPMALIRRTVDLCTSIMEFMKLQKWYHDSVLLSNTGRWWYDEGARNQRSPQEEPVWLNHGTMGRMKNTNRTGSLRAEVLLQGKAGPVPAAVPVPATAAAPVPHLPRVKPETGRVLAESAPKRWRASKNRALAARTEPHVHPARNGNPDRLFAAVGNPCPGSRRPLRL